MSKIIRVKDLKYILSSLGYKPEKTKGSHNVYKHPVINSFIIFQGPSSGEFIPKIVLSAIIKNIINSNVANEQEIQKLIEIVQMPSNQLTQVKIEAFPAPSTSKAINKRKTNDSSLVNSPRHR